MATYGPLPGVAPWTMQTCWMANSYAEGGDDPVPPQFATRYMHSNYVVPQAPFAYPPPIAPTCNRPIEIGNGVVPPVDSLTQLPARLASSRLGPVMTTSAVTATTNNNVAVVTSKTVDHQRKSSRGTCLEAFGGFRPPAASHTCDARLLNTAPPITTTRPVFNLNEVDHPSYMRPPHLEALQKKQKGGSKDSITIDSGYCSATTSPTTTSVYNVFQLIPAEPMPAPAPLSIEMSGAQVADATASLLYDLYAGRFGAIGAPSPKHRRRASSGPAIDGSLFVTTRGEFALFARQVLTGTRVATSVVANAVSYLCDPRLCEELRARSLQLSFVAALSISHKTLDDSPFTTATWAKLAHLDLNELRAAERAICYGLSFEVRPELNVERFIDASNGLMSRLMPDSQGRMLLNSMVDAFIVSC